MGAALGACDGATVHEGNPAKGAVVAVDAACTLLARKPHAANKVTLTKNDLIKRIDSSFKILFDFVPLIQGITNLY